MFYFLKCLPRYTSNTGKHKLYGKCSLHVYSIIRKIMLFLHHPMSKYIVSEVCYKNKCIKNQRVSFVPIKVVVVGGFHIM